jgi:hypothetical protein
LLARLPIMEVPVWTPLCSGFGVRAVLKLQDAAAKVPLPKLRRSTTLLCASIPHRRLTASRTRSSSGALMLEIAARSTRPPFLMCIHTTNTTNTSAASQPESQSSPTGAEPLTALRAALSLIWRASVLLPSKKASRPFWGHLRPSHAISRGAPGLAWSFQTMNYP